MPEQVFRGTVKYPSGKTVPNVNFKLVNFRADPDNPEHMEAALRHANRLTPAKVTVLREGFELVHDNPTEDLKTRGVGDLVGRPMEMQTDSARRNRPTEVRDAPKAPTISRAVREQDAQGGAGSVGN